MEKAKQHYTDLCDQYTSLAMQSTWDRGMVHGNRLLEFTQIGDVRLADGRTYCTDQPLTEQLGNKNVRDMIETMFGRISSPTTEGQCFFQCALQGRLEHRVGWSERGRGTGTAKVLVLKYEALMRLVKGPIVGRLPVRDYCGLHGLPVDENHRKSLLQANQDRRAVESMQTIDHMYFATALVLGQPIVVFKEYEQEGTVECMERPRTRRCTESWEKSRLHTTRRYKN